jgi:hypothetical protein
LEKEGCDLTVTLRIVQGLLASFLQRHGNTHQGLIGEDDHIVSLDMQRQVGALGFQVDLLAGTPRDVVFLARELLPDVIVRTSTSRGMKTASRSLKRFTMS